MNKINLMYIVNSLKASGPSNQLEYIIRNIDRKKFQPHLIILSQVKNNQIQKFEKLDMDVYQLRLSKTQFLLSGKRKVIELIRKTKPAIIHSHGIRPDILISKIDLEKTHWLLTARNYPYHDYKMKFGKVIGSVMSIKHITAMKKCKNVISCSKSIKELLINHKVKSRTIYNGTSLKNDITSTEQFTELNFEKPIFIVVGNLIKRKNNEFIIRAFNEYSKKNKGSLLFLGDGSERLKLERLAHKKIKFMGHVNNVDRFMSEADILISASLSEGLPNTVLEALANKLPAILSSIPPHIELKKLFERECMIFDANGDHMNLVNLMADQKDEKVNIDFNRTIKTLETNFSEKVMSLNYQKLYSELIQ